MKQYGCAEWDERWRVHENVPYQNLLRIKSGDGGEGDAQIKVAPNGVKHIFVLEYLKCDEFYEIEKNSSVVTDHTFRYEFVTHAYYHDQN